MIYSKGRDMAPNWLSPGYWNTEKFKKLSEFVEDDDPIFYLDRHDIHLRGVVVSSFINDDHWELVSLKKAKIMIDYSDDFLNARDIITIAQALRDHNVPSEQVYMLVMDPLWEAFVKKHFNDHNLNNVHIRIAPWLLHKVVRNAPLTIERTEATKFSLLSRNYRPWRLELLLNLRDRDLLSTNMAYTFHNVEPYEKRIFTRDEMLQDAEKIKGTLPKYIVKWIDGIPYGDSRPIDKFHNFTYSVIKNSGVHILVESHWYPYQDETKKISESHNFKPNEWAPAFATEKFYKAVYCEVPFIVASTPGFLREIRSMGYKTFSPFIDESYDDIEDDHARSQAIAAEVARLDALPPKKFWKHIENLKPILEHNLAVMNALRDTESFTDHCSWMKSYLKDNHVPGPWLM